MSKHTNPQPKFRKPFISWKGRATSLQAFVESTGYRVTYTTDSALVTTVDFGKMVWKTECAPKPKRWWRVWKWW